MQAESDTGNVEYKLKLLNISSDKVDKLASQMRFRLEEGGHEAFYIIGITDDGKMVGLTDEEYKDTKTSLDQACLKNNYAMQLVNTTRVDKQRAVYEFLIREKISQNYTNISVACAGNVDSGKSTLLGVLLTDKRDNGRGSTRLNVFNFPHEIKSGRTSSMAQHILGFDSFGEVVNYKDTFGHKKSWPDIVKNSSKIITFFDLCGHEKYLKTTIMGLSSQSPDLAMILVGANMGINNMTKEHIFLCLALDIPFILIISKIDICDERDNVLRETIRQIKGILASKSVERKSVDVKDETDVITAAKNVATFSLVPIFYCSSVSGKGIDNLRSFLNLYNNYKAKQSSSCGVEFHIDQTFTVVGVGLILGGQLVSGRIRVGDRLILGPNNKTYTTVQVKSLHCKRVNVESVEAGCYVCIGLKKHDNLIPRKGCVLLSVNNKPIQVSEFTAEIRVLKAHSTTIKVGYRPILHTTSIRQCAEIVDIVSEGEKVLRTGDKGIVKFKFAYRPEYVKKGARLLLAEGRIKIIGKILNVVEEEVKVES